MERLAELFSDCFGTVPCRIEKLPVSGGGREYYRMEDGAGHRAIGTVGNDRDENEAFFRIASHLASRGIPVPEIYAIDSDRMHYLQSDLGDRSLYERLSSGRDSGLYTPEQIDMAVQAIRWLPRIQKAGADAALAAFDRTGIMFDLNYFKYCFLKNTGAIFDERRLEADFATFADMLLEAGPYGFLYRDFQSRNIIFGDSIGFIDFQGGRIGPIHYDAASFIWQARSDFELSQKERLYREYLSMAMTCFDIDPDRFREEFTMFVLFRTFQVLGAYGYRGLVQGKEHFVESIPYALKNLRQVCPEADSCGNYQEFFGRIPYLTELLSGISMKGNSSLHVSVYSFSYRNGIPEDPSGNGGGFVFDCRGMDNPGRYPEYADRTGLEREVAEFLEKRTAVGEFLENAFALADGHLEYFLKRGFTRMSVAFGCTGGQHRSVYCAERMARHLSLKYGVSVHLTHRERGITRDL